MKDKEMVVGILGGMGSYATVDFFRRLIEAFPAEKEWDRPRVIIDNNCTMPSRVRAILYHENEEYLTELLCQSVNHLAMCGANKIILACNTSHYFLPEIKKRLPEKASYLMNIIEACALVLQERKMHEVFLIASEGTIQSKIYDEVFCQYGIDIIEPSLDEYVIIREFIETIKQNKISEKKIAQFEQYLNHINYPIVLGCTELPVFLSHCRKENILDFNRIIDPLQCVIDQLVKQYYKKKR